MWMTRRVGGSTKAEPFLKVASRSATTHLRAGSPLGEPTNRTRQCSPSPFSFSNLFRRKTSLCKAPMIFLVEGSSAELAQPPAAIPGFGTPFLQELPDPLLRSRLVGWAQLS